MAVSTEKSYVTNVAKMYLWLMYSFLFIIFARKIVKL